MSSVRFGCWMLILFLGSAVVAQQPGLAESVQETATTSQGHPATSDEQAVQNLMKQYLAAYEEKDLDGMMAQWSSSAPDLAARKKELQDFFGSTGRISVTSVEIQKPVIEGEEASLRATFDLSAVDAKSGKPKDGLGKATRALQCVKEGGSWKIGHDSDAVEDLAASLVAAMRDEEKKALLDRNKPLVTPALVKSLVSQANNLEVGEQYEPALRIAEMARQIATMISDERGIVRALEHIGRVAYKTGKYDEALEAFRQVLTAAEAGGDRFSAGYAAGIMGRMYLDQGNYSLALQLSQKARELYEASGDQRGLAIALLGLGTVYVSEGRGAQALEYLSKGLAVAEQMKDQDLVARDVTTIGYVYAQQGDYATALEYYERSLAIARAQKTAELETTILANIGEIYLSQNDGASAEGYYLQSLNLARNLGLQRPVAIALQKLGRICLLRDDADHAAAYLQEALALQEKMGLKDLAPASLVDLAKLRSSQKDYDQAFVYFDRSLRLSQELHATNKTAFVLARMANARYAQKDFVRAFDLADQALDAVKGIDDPDTIWQSLTIEGQSDLALHKQDHARAAFVGAVETIEHLREETAGGAEEQQTFFFGKLAPYHGLVQLYVEQDSLSEALSYAERAKGRALLDVLAKGRVSISKTMTADERQREDDLQAQLVSLNRQMEVAKTVAKPDPARMAELQTELEKARLQFSDFRANLYAVHPELRSQRGQIEAITLGDVAGLLQDSHSAILEFLVSEEKTYLFVLTRKSGEAAAPELKVYTIDVTSKDLAQKAERLRQQLSARDLEFSTSAASLYDLLLRPAQAQLSGVNALLIVPDGPLWNLPFQALRERPGRYLLEDYALSYAPSLTILREMVRLRLRRQTPSGLIGHTLLAMGNPALIASTLEHAKLTYRDETLAPLPEAAREVKAIEDLYGTRQSQVFVGAAAAEDRFKAQAGDFKVLHLATHGLLNDSNPMYSHLLLAPGNSKEDGLLEAREIMDLDLHADLAVLSACETARGHITPGEGVIGLSWAFFVAGVPTLVVSQWKVESSSTAELMLAFHRSLRAQHAKPHSVFSTARALQEAELQLLQNPRYTHPFYWAGFIVIGDPQ